MAMPYGVPGPNAGPGTWPQLENGVFVPSTVLALRVIRFIPYLALFCLPIATSLWVEILRERGRVRWRRVEPWLALLVPCLLVAWLVIRGPSFRMGGARLEYGWGLYQPRAMPVVKHLHAIGYQGGLFNEYEDGGYLVYAGKGRIKPVIDARIDIYGADLVEAWKLARLDPEEGEPAWRLIEKMREENLANVIYEAGLSLPSCAGDLRSAARLFDEIWYGGRPAGPESYSALRDLDRAVRAARPTAATVTSGR